MIDPKKLWLDRRHPEYTTYQPHWEFLRDAYVGGPEYLGKYLFRFWREDEDDFGERARRAQRYNYVRAVVDIISGFLWQQLPMRQHALVPDAVEQMWQNADRAGTRIDDFMAQHLTPWTATLGRVFVLVDKPAELAATRADELQRKLFPYLKVFSPIHVLDGRFANGEFDWVLLEDYERDDVDPKNADGGAVEAVYWLWDRSTWERFRIVGEGDKREAFSIGQGAHNLGIVPIVPIDHWAPITSWVSPSLVWDMAYLDRSIFNHTSLLDEILYNVTFPQLRIPWQSTLDVNGADGRSDVDVARDRVLQMATNKAFTYDGTSPTPPDWMAPDPGPAATLETRIANEVDQLFRMMSLAGEMASEVSEASGTSKEHEFRKLNKLLSRMAANHEVGERRIARIAARWHGGRDEDVPDDAVDYAEEFDVATLMDRLEEIKEASLAGLPEVVLAAMKREYVAVRFPKLPELDRKALEDAIDAAAAQPTIDPNDDPLNGERNNDPSKTPGAGDPPPDPEDEQ